eukprot:CAMPEP_0194300706 /NCGR_PEP_ID=MMETSP0169-20130528/61404_1 /TAXON_ID=218684 /ORGANISM="Corethron pennatum, Strain L29A3" /LENGTH=332 /DNA_ID=CAMNT_0039050901 /DNA_START=136 /DNA_END=1134 /DNA_ORIENTATION=-
MTVGLLSRLRCLLPWFGTGGPRGGAATFHRLDALDNYGPADPSLAAYTAASSVRACVGEGIAPPFCRGVVLIGGFGDPPSYWDRLLPLLRRRGASIAAGGDGASPLFILAPRNPGWGRTDFREARCVTRKEWVLAARDSLKVASSLCSHVTVVAHSTGAPVVAAASSYVTVDRMVFTGPNFLPATRDRSIKRLLVRPVIGKTITFIKPIISKRLREGSRPTSTISVANHRKGFYLLHFPLHAIREMWLLQDEVLSGTTEWGVREGVLFVMGEEDKSVGPLDEQVDTLRHLVPEGNIETKILRKAAHNLCGEGDTVLEEFAQLVLDGRAGGCS